MSTFASPILSAFDAGGLHISFSDNAQDGVLEAFYEIYDRAFVLENEKEAYGGFSQCLALNHGPRSHQLHAQFGPFLEVLAIARLEESGPVIGGANFVVLSQPADVQGSRLHTLNLNYLFVDANFRGHGTAWRIQQACEDLAGRLMRHWHGSSSCGLTFLEINDPFRLTPEQYRLDSEHAGIDQIARLGYWAQHGARVLDWPYVQPALSEEQADDDTLALAVIGKTGSTLPARVLQEHLHRFFAISVLKGHPLESVPSAVKQMQRLEQMSRSGEAIDLLGLTGATAGIREQLAQRGDTRARRLAQAIREIGK